MLNPSLVRKSQVLRVLGLLWMETLNPMRLNDVAS